VNPLEVDKFKDYCVNGIQGEGKVEILQVVTGARLQVSGFGLCARRVDHFEHKHCALNRGLKLNGKGVSH